MQKKNTTKLSRKCVLTIPSKQLSKNSTKRSSSRGKKRMTGSHTQKSISNEGVLSRAAATGTENSLRVAGVKKDRKNWTLLRTRKEKKRVNQRMGLKKEKLLTSPKTSSVSSRKHKQNTSVKEEAGLAQ